VEAFTEKPDASTAEAMLATGSHYWNAGMYVSRTDVLLGHLSRFHPSLEQGVRDLAEAWDGPQRGKELDRIWPDLTRIAIDHAIAEPVAAEGGVAVVPGDLDWYDIGDFAVLASLIEPGPDGVRLLQREIGATTIDAPGAMVVGGERPMVIIGVEDVTVVDAPEAILVLGKGSAQKVKQAMEETR
ncbi:MAG: sugar phosphate nucleotidyltransferase, partial [Demequinaceae bacterium]|nr:sugar phosphate nucleotidyltransferase [Demequinaceae bacterium]